MTNWIIEPHDPIIVRDGRPFTPIPGIQATSLPFPFPSTTTGAVRTRAGLANGSFDSANIPVVLHIQARGPLLAQLSTHGTNEIEDWFFPAPADALLFAHEKKFLCKQLVPVKIVDEAYTNLNATAGRNGHHSLAPVGLPLINTASDTGKPAKDAPHFWKRVFFEQWLTNPSNTVERGEITRTEIGHHGPERERRMHVSIDVNRLVAKEGELFGTSGLEFTHSEQHHLQDAQRLTLTQQSQQVTTEESEQHRLHNAQRLALVVAVDGDNADAERRVQTMNEGLAGFGGERRMVSWRKCAAELPPCPAAVLRSIVEHRACRLILLTPAYFKEGYYPSALLQPRKGVTPQVEAIAIQRPQVVSGWDLVARGPKPTRRLAPAGTVLFLSLKGSDEAISAWVADTWMRCVSDDEQSNMDGFGLAVVGTWSGKGVPMQQEQSK